MGKFLKGYFSKEEIQAAIKHISRGTWNHYSSRKCKCHSTLTRIARIKKSGKCWWEYREILTLMPFWLDWKMVLCLWKTVWQFLKWLSMEFAYDPAIPHLGKCPREMGTHVHTKTCTLMFIETSFIIAKWCEPTNGWINKI